MEVHTKALLFITICVGQLVVCQLTCDPNNRFINDALVLPYLDGIYYKVYTTSQTFNNQIFEFRPDTANNALSAHVTDDSLCCKLITISTIAQPSGYYDSQFSTLGSCPMPFSESVKFKALATNAAQLGGLLGGLLDPVLNLLQNLCVILWVCRASSEGVHVYCRQPTVSTAQMTWIQSFGSTLNLNFTAVAQNISYRNTQCITNY